MKNSQKLLNKTYIIKQKKLSTSMIILSIASILLTITAKHVYTQFPHTWSEFGPSTGFMALQVLIVFASLILAKRHYIFDLKLGTNKNTSHRIYAIMRIIIPLGTMIFGFIFWFNLYLTPATCLIFLIYEFSGKEE